MTVFEIRANSKLLHTDLDQNRRE